MICRHREFKSQRRVKMAKMQNLPDPSAMTKSQSLRHTLTLTAACAIGLVARPAQAENWSSLAFIPSTRITVSYDKTSTEKDHGLTRVWYLFTYAIPVTTAEGYVFRSYKEQEIVDCKLRASFTASFVAYSEVDGGGRIIYRWTGPTAVMPPLQPYIPGTVRAIMIDAACEPPPPKLPPLPPVPPVPASGATAASGSMAAPPVTMGVAPAIPTPATGSAKPLP
jgi:hypothetical protein